jgi:FKBP-type peptidyl-prolyl cis-trans isomerase
MVSATAAPPSRGLDVEEITPEKVSQSQCQVAASSQKQEPSVAAPKPKAKGKAKTKCKVKGKAKASAKGRAATNKNAIAALLKMKSAHGSVTTMANKLVVEIDGQNGAGGDAKFEWAKADRFVGKLKRGIRELESAIENESPFKKAVFMGVTPDEGDITDPHEFLSKVACVDAKIDSVKAIHDRIRSIQAEDSPSL